MYPGSFLIVQIKKMLVNTKNMKRAMANLFGPSNGITMKKSGINTKAIITK